MKNAIIPGAGGNIATQVIDMLVNQDERRPLPQRMFSMDGGAN